MLPFMPVYSSMMPAFPSREMKMLDAMSVNVELGVNPRKLANVLALVKVSAIKGIVKPPLSTMLAYSSGSVILINMYDESFLVTTSE